MKQWTTLTEREGCKDEGVPVRATPFCHPPPPPVSPLFGCPKDPPSMSKAKCINSLLTIMSDNHLFIQLFVESSLDTSGSGYHRTLPPTPFLTLTDFYLLCACSFSALNASHQLPHVMKEGEGGLLSPTSLCFIVLYFIYFKGSIILFYVYECLCACM